MLNSHRLSIFKERGFYFRGYKIKKQTGKHKDNEKNPTPSCAVPLESGLVMSVEALFH